MLKNSAAAGTPNRFIPFVAPTGSQRRLQPVTGTPDKSVKNLLFERFLCFFGRFKVIVFGRNIFYAGTPPENVVLHSLYMRSLCRKKMLFCEI